MEITICTKILSMRTALVLIPLLLATLVSAAPTAVTLRPAANMYSKAGVDTDVVSQAIYGTRLEILEETAGWANVRTPDGYTGWMPAGDFRKLKESEPPYASSGRMVRVEALFANLYREPDVTTFAPVLVVPFETKLEVNAEPEDNGARWIRIALADGRLAWVQRGDVTLDDAPIPISALPALGKRFLGLPYLWGGTSTFGYDCSGFVQMLYRRAGVILPRDAQPQADWSGVVAVESKDLRPGDLLFFGSSPKKITHTGMYIGDGEFINATVHEHPVVRIDKLGEPSWTKLLVAARRLK
jgi:gamma-D-glutamyl-L-lysine dipeptidyl-peptidase